MGKRKRNGRKRTVLAPHGDRGRVAEETLFFPSQQQPALLQALGHRLPAEALSYLHPGTRDTSSWPRIVVNQGVLF